MSDKWYAGEYSIYNIHQECKGKVIQFLENHKGFRIDEDLIKRAIEQL